MIALIQRVSRAKVSVAGLITGEIGCGLLIFLGVKRGDGETDAQYLASRVSRLRVFNDAEGKMNLSLQDVGGSVLVVSQFTLHADTRKGNRPSYGRAAEPGLAEDLYDLFILELRKHLGADKVGTGEFGAMMDVELINDGPVTVTVKSKSEYAKGGEDA